MPDATQDRCHPDRAFETFIRVHKCMDGRSADTFHFDEVFRETWPSVFRFAVAWTNDLQTAEDLAQEAFTRLWERRDSVDWERPVIGWLLVVTRRLATDRFRRLHTPNAGPRVRDLNEDGIATWLDVRAAFGRLSARERAALITVGLLGFTPEEAAEPLGMTAGGVRAAVSRAREKLGSER